MAKIAKILLMFKGTYSASTTYNSLDCVRYDGTTWVCKQDDTSGVAPSESTYWTILAQDGTLSGTLPWNSVSSKPFNNIASNGGFSLNGDGELQIAVDNATIIVNSDNELEVVGSRFDNNMLKTEYDVNDNGYVDAAASITNGTNIINYNEISNSIDSIGGIVGGDVYNNEHDYSTNDMCIFNNIIYKYISQETGSGIAPPTATHWQTVSLKTLSQSGMTKDNYATQSDNIVDTAYSLNGLQSTITELNYLQGSEDNIQDQIDDITTDISSLSTRVTALEATAPTSSEIAFLRQLMTKNLVDAQLSGSTLNLTSISS